MLSPAQIAALPYRPCVGVMLINRAGLIFTGQRLDSDIPAWQMPQGGIDPGESPEQAAWRELEEETGVSRHLASLIAEAPDWISYDLPDDLVGKVWKGRYRGQRQRWFALRFEGQDSDVNIAKPHPEFARWQWSSAEAMLQAIVPFKRNVYEQVVAAFRPHLA